MKKVYVSSQTFPVQCQPLTGELQSQPEASQGVPGMALQAGFPNICRVFGKHPTALIPAAPGIVAPDLWGTAQ